jgi:hypothetical protein
MKLENFSSNFWIDFNNDYFNYFAVKMFPLKNYLRDFYRMSNEEIIDFARYVESEVYNNIKKDISKRTKEISTIAVDLFKKKFWFEKENIQRNWNRLEEDEIIALYKKTKAEFADLFETFKLFRVPKNPLQCKIIFLFIIL